MVLDVAAFSDCVSVTATKAGPTDIQSTPIAVTSLPDRTLEALQVEKIEALAGFVPTLTVSEGPTGSPLLTIRGIGSNSGVAGVEPSSTFHVDGVYAGRPAMVSVGLMDVERIEVLRGPQGTLYGRNSVGGTVNIVSRQPTNTLATRGRVLAGADDKLRVEGAVSGPLAANRLMGRFAFLRGSHDGYVKDLEHPDNPLGSEDTWAARGQMRVVLGRRNELLLSADYGRFDGTPLPYAKAIQARPGFDIDIPASLWLVRASHEASGDVTQKGTTARVTAQLTDTISMMSLTAYRKSDSRISIDPDGTELPIVTVAARDFARQISQELNIGGRVQKLTWLAGSFFYDEHGDGPVEITLFGTGRPKAPILDRRYVGLGAVRTGDIRNHRACLGDGRRSLLRRAERCAQHWRRLPPRHRRACRARLLLRFRGERHVPRVDAARQRTAGHLSRHVPVWVCCARVQERRAQRDSTPARQRVLARVRLDL